MTIPQRLSPRQTEGGGHCSSDSGEGKPGAAEQPRQGVDGCGPGMREGRRVGPLQEGFTEMGAEEDRRGSVRKQEQEKKGASDRYV
jgi:hypothetical protein